MTVNSMDKETASQITDLMIEFGGRLDQSVSLVQEKCTDSEFKKYRTSVAKLMGDMLFNIINPIFDEHPELKPNQLE